MQSYFTFRDPSVLFGDIRRRGLAGLKGCRETGKPGKAGASSRERCRDKSTAERSIIPRFAAAAPSRAKFTRGLIKATRAARQRQRTMRVVERIPCWTLRRAPSARCEASIKPAELRPLPTPRSRTFWYLFPGNTGCFRAGPLNKGSA